MAEMTDGVSQHEDVKHEGFFDFEAEEAEVDMDEADEAEEQDDDDEDMDVDVDDEDFASGRKLTCPGEPITSASAFMRYVRRRSSRDSTNTFVCSVAMERMWRMTRSSHRSPARSTG